MRINNFAYRYSRGMTLIEVMVAFVIVSIGLLGIAALQTKAMQGTIDNQYRTKATDLASSLADRMRANPLADNSYIITNCPAAVPNTVCAMTPAQVQSHGDTINCTNAQMAVFDIGEICLSNGASDALPEGDIVVTCADADGSDVDVCSAGSPLTINITWSTKSET
ncbi:MAG: type IV pilus modification protein PilV, partial [Gammaproteobacteria bacterium]|nr:type IV pilus modification protein PilV [Gammaproteobacteria bacterium]